MQKRAFTEQRDHSSDVLSSEARNTLVIKLQQEVKTLKENKNRLEEALHMKTVSEAEKATEIGNLHKEYEIKLKDIMKEHKQQLQKTETEKEFSAKNTSGQLNPDDIGYDTGLPEKYVLPSLENGLQNVPPERPGESPLHLDVEDIFSERYLKKRTGKQKISPSSSSKGSRESINSSDLEVSQVCVVISKFRHPSPKYQYSPPTHTQRLMFSTVKNFFPINSKLNAIYIDQEKVDVGLSTVFTYTVLDIIFFAILIYPQMLLFPVPCRYVMYRNSDINSLNGVLKYF